MKLFYSIVIALGLLLMPSVLLAHGADRNAGEQSVLALQAGTVTCADLTDAQFENMGDYYMEAMMGETHEQMDQMMEAMMGEEGLTQMHVAMGKRMSGCDTSAPMPGAMMSGMMGMMGGGGMMGQEGISGGGMMNAMQGEGRIGSMLGSFYPPGFVTLWYVVGALGAVALVLAIVKYLRELFK